MMWLLVFSILVANSAVRVTSLENVDRVKLIDNGYEGILVAISPDVAESATLISKIKALIMQGSGLLYVSTGSRAYFRKVTILVPSTWSDSLIDGQAEHEVYHNADIRIDEAKADEPKPHLPSTKMFHACGQPGKYIRFTTDYVINAMSYITKVGIPAFVMVHEWAHLRWGVLDEYGTMDANRFYFRSDTNNYEATRCTLNVDGDLRTVDESGAYVKAGCDTDPDSGMYTNCQFKPKTTAKPASIMYYTLGSLIQKFCDNDINSPTTLHNSDAPTLHNTACASKSAWEIMRETEDFKNGSNPARTLAYTDRIPSFRVVRDHKTRPIMIILDVSGSMKKDRLTAMRQAVSSFVESVAPGNIIGLLKFSAQAELLVEPTEIKTEQDRQNLLNAIPDKVRDFTSIGAGLKLALETLKSQNLTLTGALFVLLTDGKENRKPNIVDLIPELTDAKVVVTTLAFSRIADPSLVEISANTDGSYFYDKDGETSSGLTEAFQELLIKTDPDPERLVFLFIESFPLKVGQTKSIEFYIDESIGVNTKVRIGYTKNLPVTEVRISGPDGQTASCTANQSFKTIVCMVGGRASVGKWIVEIPGHSSIQKFTVAISSERFSKSDPPIIARSEISSTKTSLPPKTVIYAELTKAGNPVLGMTVNAIIDRPFSGNSRVQLFDDGSGSDLIANDGIYSLSFSDATGTGRYAITVEIKPPANGKAVLKKTQIKNVGSPIVGILQDDGKMLVAKDTYSLINGLISRTTSPGAFDIAIPGGTAPQKLSDITGYTIDTPPSRIKDLLVIQTSENDGTVKLAWTAPGENADTGKATSYDIRHASTAVELLSNPFSSNVIQQNQVLSGNLASPKSAGSLEIFVIKVAHVSGTNSSHSFVVRAIDDSNKAGEFSNVVSAGLGYVPDLKIRLLTPYELATLLRNQTQAPTEVQPTEPTSTAMPEWLLVLIIALSITVLIAIIVLGTVVILKNRDNTHPKVKPFTAVV